MKTTNATKRPWSISDYPNGFKLEIVAGDGIVCTVAGTSGTTDETKANAALIVQAVNERSALLAVAEAAGAVRNLYTLQNGEYCHAMNERAAQAFKLRLTELDNALAALRKGDK